MTLYTTHEHTFAVASEFLHEAPVVFRHAVFEEMQWNSLHSLTSSGPQPTYCQHVSRRKPNMNSIT